MNRFSLALLGLLLVFMGLAMLGMRAGYWVFVVGVKTIVALAVSVTAIAWYVSSARAMDQSTFTLGYQDYVNMATARGISPRRVCFANYCANQMSLMTNEGEVLLSNQTSNVTGLNMQEVCITPPSTPTDRVCSTSEGRMFKQRLKGNIWDTYQIITDHFD